MTTFDPHPNFAYSTVSVAPSPATSGITLGVADASVFPDPVAVGAYQCTIWPTAANPVKSNAEIVRVTGKSGSTLTITRIQESTSARTVIVGDQIAATDTSKVFTDIETAINSVSGGAADVQYIEGDTDASITGNAIMWEDAADTLRSVSAAKPLPVATDATQAEDAPAGSGDKGMSILAVRRDAASAGAADGDYCNVSVDSSGALRVVGSSAATEYTEDGAAVSDPVGGMQLARRRDTLSTSEVSGDGDVIALNATNKGQLHTFSEIGTMPAAARTTDHIGAALITDALMNGLTALTPKFVTISCTTSGTNVIVSAVSGKKIRVVSLFLVCSAATNVYWTDGAAANLAGGSTNKINLAANGGFVLPFNPVGWFETSTTNTNLVLNLSAANPTGGSLCYLEI